jgi:hypothetical protein
MKEQQLICSKNDINHLIAIGAFSAKQTYLLDNIFKALTTSFDEGTATGTDMRYRYGMSEINYLIAISVISATQTYLLDKIFEALTTSFDEGTATSTDLPVRYE